MIVATIADIHFNALPADKIYDQLDKVFLNFLRGHSDIDMVVIAGDFYDSIVSLNSRASRLSITFIQSLIDVASETGIKYIRIIKGTSSHDNNQLLNLKVYENSTKVDFRIFETVTSELLMGNSILYIPEEYMKDVDEFYKGFFHHKYDMIFGHGMFKETAFTAKNQESAITLSKAPVFDSKQFCEMCRGPIIFGHIHTSCSIRDKITYVGSFSRWIFGEEKDKGFLLTKYEDGKFTNEFIKNTMAEAYDTITLHGIDSYLENPKSLCEHIDSLNHGHLRVIVILEGDKEYSIISNYLKEFYTGDKAVTLQFVNKNEAIKEAKDAEKINNLMEKYGFIFDSNIPHEEKIAKFIKIRDERHVPLERIRKLLGSE